MAGETVAAVAAGHQAAAGASSILTGVVTGLLTGLTSVVVLLLTGFGKDRSTRFDLLIKYANEQINDFYAPLVALTSQLAAASDALVAATEGRSDDERSRITSLMCDAVFDPLHASIMTILTSKLYLLEGRTMPDSFDAVIAHITALTVRQNLSKRGVNSVHIPVPPYPDKFYDDVRATLDVVSSKQDRIMAELQRLALPAFPRLARWVTLIGYKIAGTWQGSLLSVVYNPERNKTTPIPPRTGGTVPVVHYLAVVEQTHGVYTMTVPDCPGCTGKGARFADALDAVSVSLQAWIANHRASEADVPRPRNLTNLRADPELVAHFSKGAVLAAVPTPSDRLRSRKPQQPSIPMADVQ